MTKEVLDRLNDEYIELHTRLMKLENFMMDDTYTNLSDKEKRLLDAQYHAMECYKLILKTRIELYTK